VRASARGDRRITCALLKASIQPGSISHLEELNVASSMSEIMNPSAAKSDPDFPHAPADWSREVAVTAAKADGIELEGVHWEVIQALQAYFDQHERPNVRELHDALEERFHGAGGLKFLYEKLPGGTVAQGCRFAGLNAPAGATDKSFGSVQ
jgi:tRNA 2-thiouridine synthesizing protein E